MKPNDAISDARLAQRGRIVKAAEAMVGSTVSSDFDPFHSPICVIDVVMAAGAPWLKDGIERDFYKDESGYRKIGGGANTPQAAYFYRSTANLIHYLKRQGLYIARGEPKPCYAGMMVFFDWADRGRFNFTPDRCGVVLKSGDSGAKEVAIARKSKSEDVVFSVERVSLSLFNDYDNALIGYSDFP